MIRITPLVLLIALAPAPLAKAQPQIGEWTAPLYWAEDVGLKSGNARAAAITGPLPLVGVTPCRVLDTRPEYAQFGFTGVFGAPAIVGNIAREIPIPLSSCGIPPNARAYSLNFTVVPIGPLQYLTAWPTGQARPNVSTLNSPEGKLVANAALVPAGLNGSISVFVTETAHVIIDINGYYTDLPVSMSGPAGPVGPAGAPGVMGPAGPIGPIGVTGPTGAPGPTGATGLMGPIGPTGATGPAGVSGWERLTAVQNLNAGTITTRQLSCPTGKKVLTGGYHLASSLLNIERINIRILESYPDTESTWSFTIFNGTLSNANFDLYIICATASGATGVTGPTGPTGA